MKRRSAGEGRVPGAPATPARSTAVVLGILLGLASPRAARAEDSLTYKYEDYDEAGGRVDVRSQAATATTDLGPQMQLILTAVEDAIAGASPTGQPAPEGSAQVPLARLTDHRKAWEMDLSRRLGITRLAVGVSESREHDYVSRGWSLNTLTDLNEKNTTVLVGVAGHDDDVETFFEPSRTYEEKQAFSAVLGVTQILGPLTTVTVDFSWSRETGDLNDQYKLVQKTEQIVAGSYFPLVFAENRPGARDRGTALASFNRAFPKAKGAAEAVARFYADTFGVEALSWELRWIQKFGDRFTLAPEVRAYEQSAARFYYYDLDSTRILPTVIPNPAEPAYSSDYRLSSFVSLNCGLKATWTASRRLQLDLGYDHYGLRGRDGVTPQSAYPVANILSAGARISW